MQDRLVENSYLKLTLCLEEILKLYTTLLSIVSREKELLLLAEADNLMENTKSKEMCLHRLRSLETERIRYASDLAGHMNLASAEPRLLEIAEHLALRNSVSKTWSEKLRQLHGALEIAVVQVYEMNQDNKTYAQSALATLKGALGDIKQTLVPKPVYGRQGRMSESSEQSGHFVSREG